MDTKQKNRERSRENSAKRPPKRRPEQRAAAPSGEERRQQPQEPERRARSAAPAAGRPDRPVRPDQPAARREMPRQRQPRPERTREEPAAYRRTPPQGASVYGASTGGGARAKVDPNRSVARKPQEPTGFQKLLNRGAAIGKNANASRERVMKAQKQMAARRKKKRQRQHDTPAVIYTEPKPFNRSKLLVQLMTVAAVVIALVMGLSVFFKVEVISVSGAETYSAWAVREASGISEGDNLLTFSRARASAQIRAELPYVERVRIGIKLPNTVNIYIEELDVVYAIQDRDGIWWLITSEGRVVEKSDSSSAEQYTKILGVTLDSPAVGQNAVAAEEIPAATGDGETGGESEATVPITVTGAQRLSAALEILRALEANDIVGEAASVNVSSVNSIELWYGTRYQVNLGDTTRMEYKIACMNDAILELKDYQTGMLDISLTTWADQVVYTPFS